MKVNWVNSSGIDSSSGHPSFQQKKNEEISEDAYSSDFFIQKSDLLNTLFPEESKGPLELEYEREIFETKSETTLKKTFSNSDVEKEYSDDVVIYNWKNIENISARLIDYSDIHVTLECLIDREYGIYEERDFRRSLFKDNDIVLGKLFYLRIFDRPNETKLEIHADPGLHLEKDFPKQIIAEKFKDSSFFKKK